MALSSFDRQAVQSHSWKVTGLRFNHMNPCPHSSHDALQSSPFPQGSLTGEKTSLFFIVVQVQLSPFLTHFSTPPPSHPHYPPLILFAFGFVQVRFIEVPENPFPFPLIIPSYLPSGYCQFVLNFNVSGYILLACLFC